MTLRFTWSRINATTRKAAYLKFPPFPPATPTPRASGANLTTRSFTMAGDEAATSDAAAAETRALPPLTDHDFKIYNRMADRMEQFVRLPHWQSHMMLSS